MRKSPGFTAVAVLVLALGFASNLEVFSLIDGLFWKPLPVDRPGELVRLSVDGQSAIPHSVLDPLRKEAMFAGVCGFTTPRLSAEVNATVRSVSILAMSGDCFSTLGLRARAGRVFGMSDDRRGGDRVALITEAFRAADDSPVQNLLGKQIQLSGEPFTIIGIADRRFGELIRGAVPEVIIPLDQTPLDFVPTRRGPIYFWSTILARRVSSIPESQIAARLSLITSQLLEASVPARYSETDRRAYLAGKIVAGPPITGADWLTNRFGKPLYAMFGLCAAVLLIGCVNLASLLLARGARRQKEIAVRVALGATRLSIVRLLALESGLLVIGGSLAGLLLVAWTRPLIAARIAELLSIPVTTGFDFRSAAFLTALVLLTATALSLAPLWQSSRFLMSRGIVGSGARNQKFVLAIQVALTLALVSGASVLTASLDHLDRLNLGMKTAGVSESLLAPQTAASALLPAGPYHRELLQHIEALPGVSSVSVADTAPFWFTPRTEEIAGVGRTQAVAVTERFFETLGIPLLAGEGFRATSEDSTAIVSQSLAKTLGGETAVGQFIQIGEGPGSRRLRVIGIAGDVQMSLANPDRVDPPVVYLNLWQNPSRQRNPILLVAGGSASDIRRAVQSRGRDYVQRSWTVDAARDAALIENRVLAWLAAAFSVLALCLAATGLFGLLSYHVTSRTAEIGLRMALGAEQTQIRWLVVRQILPVVAVGAGAGLALALAAGRIMTGLVYGVRSSDPGLLALSIAILILTAALAAWIPARRASAVDPLVALRHE